MLNKIPKLANIVVLAVIILFLGLVVIMRGNRFYSPRLTCEGTFVKEAYHIDPDGMGARAHVYLLFKLESGEEVVLEGPLTHNYVPGQKVIIFYHQGRLGGKNIESYVLKEK